MRPLIPHTPTGYGERRLAVASCHVERPLDDRVWTLFSGVQERRPGGFVIAALMRPPDSAADEDATRWLARAREAAARGPLGQHTHWGGPEQARPRGGAPAERVLREGRWLAESGVRPTLFCGGGWYLDEAVAEAVADLEYADCTATAFRPTYLAAGEPRASLGAPGRLVLPSRRRLLELPSTHSLGRAARGSLGRLAEPVVHVYFHDTDLLRPARRAALVAALTLLGRRAAVTDLDALAARLGQSAPEIEFSAVASAL